MGDRSWAPCRPAWHMTTIGKATGARPATAPTAAAASAAGSSVVAPVVTSPTAHPNVPIKREMAPSEFVCLRKKFCTSVRNAPTTHAAIDLGDDSDPPTLHAAAPQHGSQLVSQHVAVLPQVKVQSAPDAVPAHVTSQPASVIAPSSTVPNTDREPPVAKADDGAVTPSWSSYTDAELIALVQEMGVKEKHNLFGNMMRSKKCPDFVKKEWAEIQKLGQKDAARTTFLHEVIVAVQKGKLFNSAFFTAMEKPCDTDDCEKRRGQNDERLAELQIPLQHGRPGNH